jgi:3-hydroxyisobutyrate dehydrogenase
MRLGFVGTGTMGAAMAGCLIDAGHDLTIYDILPEATIGLTARGASAADSPAAAADRSEVVFTSLPGPADVELAVLEPSSGILAGLRAGGAYIDTTTNAPGVARRVAEACRARGVDVLDAPVSGRPPGMTRWSAAMNQSSQNTARCSRRWRATFFMSATAVQAAPPSW